METVRAMLTRTFSPALKGFVGTKVIVLPPFEYWKVPGCMALKRPMT